MAFLCPSQLTVKKKVLQGKAPYPDTYQLNGDSSPGVEHKSALKSPRSSTDSSHKSNHRTVRIDEAALNKESKVERKIRTATYDRPANIRVKAAHDYSSEDPEELNLSKGQTVKILYQQHDWLYVVDLFGNEGFIPFSYCSDFNNSIDSKSSTSGFTDSHEESDEIEKAAERRKIDRFSKHRNDKHKHNSKQKTPVVYFPKRPYGPKLTVLFNYKARYENDVSVERGEYVMLLNDQDADWLWVATEDGEEGFIPRTFVISHACEGCRRRLSQEPSSSSSFNRKNISPLGNGSVSALTKDTSLHKVTTDNTSSNSDKQSEKCNVNGHTRNSRNSTPHGSKMNLHSSQTELNPVYNSSPTLTEITPSSPELTPISSELAPSLDHSLLNGDIYSSDITPTSSSSADVEPKSRNLSDATSSASSDKKLELKGSRLISLYEYEGSAFDDLTVHAGEYVYANLKDQIVPKWIWAYSPYRKRSGFIPEAYLKEPVVTDI
ncbi:predicted protein [Nematostella vectensis]|uniref:SH3 domain-containing protein n=1 Tax=Nematostella vectensis TaxID=45351 RepID=A7S9D1_NEMVE|nr:SH3 domain-containing protein Dlish [Nematostella vectensis]EDO39651.1 predicted protein [Nematostella vectensis]|eukprot:XP_001631714.1 predicted protein [Nematostella vectensis]